MKQCPLSTNARAVSACRKLTANREQRRRALLSGLLITAMQLGLGLVALAQQPDLVAVETETTSALGLPLGEYDPSIKSPMDFFGFEIGSRHLRHFQLVDYFVYLSTVSDLVTTERYAKTHGGRALTATVITTQENHARLDELLKQHRKLCDPQQSNSIEVEDVPLVIYMGYGVHGDEPSGSNAAPLVAHYLCAGPGRDYLDRMIIVIDPALNPDGFDRFAAWANDYRGKTLNANPAHHEHQQAWPGGRVNYYWFDLNRDWMPLQHPESQGRAELFFRFRPNIVLDFHEMSTNATYFFQPGVPTRKHPDTPAKNQLLTRKLADFHAEALDRIGTLYFTEERFDDFYMGKGSTYPDLHGAVGILFEQASSRGHAQESVNGKLTFPFTIRNQVTTSLSSLAGAAQHRVELLNYQREFYQASKHLADQQAVRAYQFEAPDNPGRLQPFERMLNQHRINTVRLGDKLVVPTDQPEFRFLKSLFDRRTTFEENVFYDVSTWNMAFAFGLQLTELTSMPPIDATVKVDVEQRVTTPEDLQESVAVVIDWRHDAAVALLHQLLAADMIVKVAQEPFAFGADGYPPGSLMVPLGMQRDKQVELASMLTSSGAQYELMDTGLSPRGIDLGSSSFAKVESGDVLLVIGGGVDRYQAGTLWHYLDTRIKLPVTLVDIHRLESIDLSRYRSIILPRGDLSGAEGAVPNLKSWVKSGGTLLAFNSAITWASKHSLVSESFVSKPVASNPSNLERRPYGAARGDQALKLISGAIFETQIDTTHPLGYGFPDEPLAVFRNTTLRLNRSGNAYANPVVYTDAPLLAGYASSENVERLKGSASVTHANLGKGRVVMMVDEPTFRAFWYGSQRLVANAIFFGSLVRNP